MQAKDPNPAHNRDVPDRDVPDRDVTALLDRWGDGDTGAFAELIPLVYADLHRLANRSMRAERGDHTLQPTALIHEAFLRLAKGKPPDLEDRRHFYGLAARLMRQILVDHARRVKAGRRGGGGPKVPLEESTPGLSVAPEVELLAFDKALSALSEADPRKARVIELRFFGGLEVREVAELMEISISTVVTDTRVARAWLLARVGLSGAA